MLCSIIIPSHNRAASLQRTLSTLQQQTDRNFEVIVVADGIDPDTQHLAESLRATYPLRWHFHQQQRGAAEARNTGAQAATGELLVFLDDDMVPAADWVERHRSHHRPHDRMVVLGKYTNVYDRPPLSRTEALLRRFYEARNEEYWRAMRAVQDGAAGGDKEYWVGLNSSLQRSHYLQSGGCDSALLLQEDADLGSRLLRQGFRYLFDPAILLFHHDPKDLVRDRLWRAELFGRTDVYRVRDRGEEAPHCPNLFTMEAGGWRAVLAGFTWGFPRTSRVLAEICRHATDMSGLEFCFRVWSVVGFSARYWEGVRAAGLTRDDLRRLAASRHAGAKQG